MNFNELKYQHIEKWGTDEVEYLKNLSEVTVMPKIDGTNSVVHYEGNDVTVCSRNRILSVDKDNEGFCSFVNEHKDEFDIIYNYIKTLELFSNAKSITFYGEFTKKGTFTVSKNFIHKFVLFDIFVEFEDCKKYYDPNSFDFLRNYSFANIIVIPSISVPTGEIENLTKNYIEFSTFLLPSIFPHGEGFVIKDYSNHKNKYGRTTWAKILFDKTKVCDNLYSEIENNWFNNAFLDKEYLKYTENNNDKNANKFSNIVVREFFKEEIANIILKKKFPIIDTSKLYSVLIKKAIRYWISKN